MTDSKLLATAQAHFDIVGHLDTFWSKEALTAWSAALQEKEAVADDFHKMSLKWDDELERAEALEAERDRLVETARAVIAYDMPVSTGRPPQRWLDLMKATDCAPTPSGAAEQETTLCRLCENEMYLDEFDWGQDCQREGCPLTTGELAEAEKLYRQNPTADTLQRVRRARREAAQQGEELTAAQAKDRVLNPSKFAPPKPLHGGERYKPFKLVMHGGLDVVWIVTDRGVHMTSPQAAQRIAAALNREKDHG